MIVISGRTRLRQSALEQAVTAAAGMAKTSRDEPGCLDYKFSIDVEESLVLLLFEQWQSNAALDTHFATPHFAAFSDVLLSSADGPAGFTRYEILSQAPLFG
jgi:quinol monooxygenase YgiN